MTRRMDSSKAWATAIFATDILQHGHRRTTTGDDPLVLVQRTTGNVLVCGGPVEHFSQEMPIWTPSSPEEEGLRPIDILYGGYDHAHRSIEVFVKSIQRDAHVFGAEPDDLLEIVRIHEYGPADLHWLRPFSPLPASAICTTHQFGCAAKLWI